MSDSASTPSTLRYLLYARKSSESEDRQIQSIEDQLKELRHLAATRGLRIVEELTESKSAKAPNQRPVFAEVLERIRRGEADGILCWSLNRLSRNPLDSGTLSWMLQRGELAAIQTMDREYRPEDNVLLMALESGVANQFILDLQKAVIRGMQSKREKGIWPHHAPEGYLNDRFRHTIEPDPERFALLRKAWEMLLTGAYTVPQIKEQLTAWGYRSRKLKTLGGKPISRTTLYDLFSNPFYAGYFYHKGLRYDAAHKAMVSEDEWNRGQKILHKADHIKPKRYEWAYSGLIRCKSCGCAVVAERKVKHYQQSDRTVVYVYYHCSGSKRCPKVSVTEGQIDRQVSDLLERCQFHPSVEPWLREVVDRHLSEDKGVDQSAYHIQTEALLAAQKRLDSLTTMRADSEISKEEYALRREELLTAIDAAKTHLRQIETKQERDHNALIHVTRFCSTAFERFTQGDVRAKRAVANALGMKYLLTLGKLEIAPHPLLDPIITFEPAKNGSDKDKLNDMLPDDPAWRAMLDHIRNVQQQGDNADFIFPDSNEASR